MNIGIAGFHPGHERRIKIAKDIGYDFIESCLFSLNDDYSQESIDSLGEYLREINMPCIAVNGMFPRRIALLGKEQDKELIKDYLYSSFDKTKALGYKTCVLGSGRSRKVPDDYGIDRAYDEFCELLCDTIIPIAKEYGKTIAIEPLSYYICNIINTVEDSMRVVKKVADPTVMTLIDFYHVSYNKENIKDYICYGDYIQHTHIASYNNRFCFPRPYDGDDYRAFFGMLRKSGYKQENVSIEAADIDFESELVYSVTLASSLDYLRKM